MINLINLKFMCVVGDDVGIVPFDNPSVSLATDTSLYTREAILSARRRAMLAPTQINYIRRYRKPSLCKGGWHAIA